MVQAAYQLNHRQKKNIRITVVSIIVTMVIFFGLFLNKVLAPTPITKESLRANGIVLFSQPRTIAPVLLEDHNQQVLNKERLIGKYSLIFFGFTHCPDICPTTLMELAKILERVDSSTRENFQVILVSLDPARDTPDVLKQYVTYFNSDFLGATGDFKQIMSFTNNVNVAFNKVFLDDGYTIDHTSHVVVLNDRADYIGYIKQPMDIEKIASSLGAVTSFY